MDATVWQVGLPGDPVTTRGFLALLAFAAIIVGGELFATGTEWVADRFDLDEHTTGSVFTALAKTLPETLIPVVAILGRPITLTAFAPVLLGATALLATARGMRETDDGVDAEQISLDFRVFLVGFTLATAVGFVTGAWVAAAVGVGLVGLYTWYLSRVLVGASIRPTSRRSLPRLSSRTGRMQSSVSGEVKPEVSNYPYNN